MTSRSACFLVSRSEVTRFPHYTSRLPKLLTLMAMCVDLEFKTRPSAARLSTSINFVGKSFGVAAISGLPCVVRIELLRSQGCCSQHIIRVRFVDPAYLHFLISPKSTRWMDIYSTLTKPPAVTMDDTSFITRTAQVLGSTTSVIL